MIIKEEILNDEKFEILRPWDQLEKFLDETKLNKSQLALLAGIIEIFVDEINEYASSKDISTLKQGFLYVTLSDLINPNISIEVMRNKFDYVMENVDPASKLRKIFCHFMEILKGNKLNNYLTQLGSFNEQILSEGKQICHAIVTILTTNISKNIIHLEFAKEEYTKYLAQNPQSKDWLLEFVEDDFQQALEALLQQILSFIAEKIPQVINNHIKAYSSLLAKINYEDTGLPKSLNDCDPVFLDLLIKAKDKIIEINKRITSFHELASQIMGNDHLNFKKLYALYELVFGYNFHICLPASDIKLILAHTLSMEKGVHQQLEKFVPSTSPLAKKLLAFRNEMIASYQSYLEVLPKVEDFFHKDDCKQKFFKMVFYIIGKAGSQNTAKIQNNNSADTEKLLLTSLNIKEDLQSEESYIQLGFGSLRFIVNINNKHIHFYPSHAILVNKLKGVSFDELGVLLKIPANVNPSPLTTGLMNLGSEVANEIQSSGSLANYLSRFSSVFSGSTANQGTVPDIDSDAEEENDCKIS